MSRVVLFLLSSGLSHGSESSIHWYPQGLVVARLSETCDGISHMCITYDDDAVGERYSS
jgi:hypothetical protein